MSAQTESLSNRKTANAAESRAKVCAFRFAAAGAATLGALFVLCWVGAVVTTALPLSHMFVELFTAAPVTSVFALAQGLCWSLAFGALSGLLLAWFYNMFAFFEAN